MTKQELVQCVLDPSRNHQANGDPQQWPPNIGPDRVFMHPNRYEIIEDAEERMRGVNYGNTGLTLATHCRAVAHLAVVFAAAYFPEGDPRHSHAWVAGMYHDVLEDTQTTADDLWPVIGNEETRLVELLTDKPGANRRERHRATYPAMRNEPVAKLIKLADRTYNTSSSFAHRPKLYEMYVREYPYFLDTLRIDGEFDGVWELLNRLHEN